MSALKQNDGTSHGNRAYPKDFCFNEVPKNNWHHVTSEDKDRYVAKTMEHIKKAYEDVHGKD